LRGALRRLAAPAWENGTGAALLCAPVHVVNALAWRGGGVWIYKVGVENIGM
jgi:hypothetical protein